MKPSLMIVLVARRENQQHIVTTRTKQAIVNGDQLKTPALGDSMDDEEQVPIHVRLLKEQQDAPQLTRSCS